MSKLRDRLRRLERQAKPVEGKCRWCAGRDEHVCLTLRGADAIPDAEFSLCLPHNGRDDVTFGDPAKAAACLVCGWRPRVGQIVIYELGREPLLAADSGPDA